MSLAEDLQRLKERSTEFERRRAHREADIETAEKRRDEALEVLQRVHGVKTVDAAKKLADSLESEAEKAIADAQKALEEAE